MPTRVPGAGASAPPRRARAATTVPTIWWPGTTGGRGISTSPSSRWRSVRQTPHAWTRTSTCARAGLGIGDLGRPQHARSLDPHRAHRRPQASTAGRIVAHGADPPGRVGRARRAPASRCRRSASRGPWSRRPCRGCRDPRRSGRPAGPCAPSPWRASHRCRGP